MGVDLFKHNQEAYEKIKSAIVDGKKKIAIAHATGTGKSYLIAKLFEDYSNDKKLVLVPSTYISDQIKALFEKYSIQNVEVILYQRLIKMSDEDIAAMDYGVIALDEYHHDTSKVWGEKVRKLIDTHPESIIFGTSATPVRSDGVNTIDELFEGNCASDLPLSESIAKKIVPLPKYVGALYTLDAELEKLREKIENATNTKEEKQEFYKKINTMRSQIEKSYGMPIILNKHITNREGKYIVFCKKKRHLREIKNTVIDWFKTAGFKNINAYEVYSDYENKDAEYKAFCNDTSHSLKLLFCVNMLNEGLHLENISGVLLLRPTRSMLVFLQQIGRAIEANNTNTPVIIDAVNNFSSAGQGMGLLKEIKDAVTREKESDPDFDDSGFENIDTFFVLEQVIEIQEMFKEIEGSLQGNYWTEDEDEFIKKNYSKLTYKEMANIIKRTPKSISERAKRLGITINREWTIEEIQIMKKYYIELGGNEIAKYLPNRTINEIRSKAAIMNLTRNKRWSNKENEIMKKYYPTMGSNVQTLLPNRSISTILVRAQKLNLRILHSSDKWTDDEIKILKNNYENIGTGCCNILNNKSRSDICIKAKSLELKPPKVNYWTDEEDNILRKYFEDIGYAKIMEMLPNRTKASIAKRVKKLGLYYDVSKHRISKYKNVYYVKNQNRWCVKIRVNGKYKSFGYYKTEDEAGKVATEKLRELA